MERQTTEKQCGEQKTAEEQQTTEEYREEQDDSRAIHQMAADSCQNEKTQEFQKHSHAGTVILAVIGAAILAAIFTAGLWFLSNQIMQPGAAKLSEFYQNAMEQAYRDSHDEVYDISFQAAEKEFHVSNEIEISLGNIQEIQKLEVLRVSDVSYEVPEEKEKNLFEKTREYFSEDIKSWLEVPGNGVFTVNLKASEFIIDNAQKHVIVRLPNPELTNFSIDYEHVKQLYFEDDGLFKESANVGIDLAMEQLKDAELSMRLGIINNQKFFQQAKKSAGATVTNLVKQLNPGIRDLTVDVEFYD